MRAPCLVGGVMHVRLGRIATIVLVSLVFGTAGVGAALADHGVVSGETAAGIGEDGACASAGLKGHGVGACQDVGSPIVEDVAKRLGGAVDEGWTTAAWAIASSSAMAGDGYEDAWRTAAWAVDEGAGSLGEGVDDAWRTTAWIVNEAYQVP